MLLSFPYETVIVEYRRDIDMADMLLHKERIFYTGATILPQKLS
jgi:hypothetical protein